MGYSFAKPSEFTGGAVFKPGDHMNDLALLIEPTRIDRGRPQHLQRGDQAARRGDRHRHRVRQLRVAGARRRRPTVIKDVQVVHGDAHLHPGADHRRRDGRRRPQDPHAQAARATSSATSTPDIEAAVGRTSTSARRPSPTRSRSVRMPCVRRRPPDGGLSRC